MWGVQQDTIHVVAQSPPSCSVWNVRLLFAILAPLTLPSLPSMSPHIPKALHHGGEALSLLSASLSVPVERTALRSQGHLATFLEEWLTNTGPSLPLRSERRHQWAENPMQSLCTAVPPCTWR